MHRKIFKFIVIFLVMTGWIFSGWPQIFNFPPGTKVARAATPTVQSVTAKLDGAVNSTTVSSVPSGTNQLYIAVGHFYLATGAPPIGNNEISSISGGDLTWAAITGTTGCSDRITQIRAEMWWAYGSPSSTFSVVATLASTTNASGTQIAVVRIDGAANEMPINGEYANTAGDAAACDTTGTDTATSTIGATVSNANSLILNSLHPRNATAADLASTTADADYTQQYAVSNFSGGNGSSMAIYSRGNAPTGTDTIAHILPVTKPWVMTVIEIKEAASAATLTQNDFEFWEDNDALTPTAIWGNPDIAENTALNAVPPSNSPIDPGDEIRVRMNISVTGATLATSTEDFILQYKETSDCTDGAAWTDVDVAGGTATWRFSSSTVTDNSTLTTLLVSTSDVAGRYNKSDPTTTNPNAVTAGQELEWDWHLEYNGNAEAHTYCFRMVKSPVAALDGYNSDSYPRIDTRPGTADQMRHGNFFTTGVERGFFWAD